MNAPLDAKSIETIPESPLRVGVWVDDAFTQIDRAYAARLRALGIDEACLMINQMNAHASAEPWRLRAPATSITHAARVLTDAGLDVVLTCWPRPSTSQLNALHDEMKTLMRATDARALEVDVEANWHARFLDGFSTMDAAASVALDCLRDAACGAHVELTTFPRHEENGPRARLAPHVDATFPQAYSVNERDGRAVPWDHAYGPGKMQSLTHASATHTRCPRIGLGLAAYEQRWAGHTQEDAMQTALETARALGVTHVRYWSAKWIVGARGQPWARNAIKRAKGR
jgi:hypothetical protein